MKKLALALSIGFTLLSCAVHAQDEEFISHGLSVYGQLQPPSSGCTVLMSKYVINLHNDGHALPYQDWTSAYSDDRIYIQLGGKSCDANEGYKNIGLRFLGTVDNSMGNVLANTATSSSAAQGTGVQLTDMLHKLIIPNSTVAFFPSADPAGKPTEAPASFPLNLTLVRLKNQDSTPGDVQTNLTVQIERL